MNQNARYINEERSSNCLYLAQKHDLWLMISFLIKASISKGNPSDIVNITCGYLLDLFNNTKESKKKN